MPRPNSPRVATTAQGAGEAKAPAPDDPGARVEGLDRDSLISELETLLQAERAGAKVAAGLVAQAASPALKGLAEMIRRDEVRWCRMLSGALRDLGATPSVTVGAFYEKATAISDLEARFAFVNRGQAWVVRKLEALVPRVRGEGLHADLLEMLAAHDRNIAEAESTLTRLARIRSRRRAIGEKRKE